MATLGALGYAAYKYYGNNRDKVDGAIRGLTSGERGSGSVIEDTPGLAGGPLSGQARVVHAGEGPLA
ncbi:hypothetical protein [Tsuneonella deserti]|nr:hypothetical protein [Tsuneonella deserti]